MTNRQEDQLNMFDEVVLYSETNEVFTTLVPVYATVLLLLKARITEIKATDAGIKDPIAYYAAEKNNFKNQVSKEAAKICKALNALGVSLNFMDLINQSEYTETELKNMRDEELPQILNMIWSRANQAISDLGPYGITPANLTAFTDLIEAYNNRISSPRQAIVNRKTLVSKLQNQFKEVNAILKDRLDNIAAQVPDDNFFIGYKNARIIVDSVTRHTKVDGTVIDAANSDPISGVDIKVIVGTKTFLGASGVDGSFVIKTPKPGSATVFFKKAGFQDMQTSVTLVKGQTTHMGNVQMVLSQP